MGKVFKRPLPPRGPMPSNPNLLDNWYFADPINQKGQTEYSGVGYTIDRWKALTNTLVLVTQDGVVLQNTFSDISFWRQAIDIDLTHTILSLSALDNNINLYTVSGRVIDKDIGRKFSTTTGNFGSLYFEFRYGNYGVVFSLDVGQSHKWLAAKLELGSQQTLAYLDEEGKWQLNDPPPDKALELAKCQYYLYPITNNETLRASAVFDGQARFTIPVTMADRALSVLAPENISFRPWGAGGEQAIIPSGWSAYVRPQGAVELRAHLSSIKLGEDYYLSVKDGQGVLLSNEL